VVVVVVVVVVVLIFLVHRKLPAEGEKNVCVFEKIYGTMFAARRL
jgi:hypothetical protein